MGLDFTAYYEGENFVGFTIVYPRPSFSWYWYFAVLLGEHKNQTGP
jgi:hypothetical protein